MSKCWQEDSELFLRKGHRKSDVLHLWRCKKSTPSSSIPLHIGDFTDEGPVPDYLSLVGRCFKWKIEQYDALVNYITPRHFLVNCQGLVFVELYKFGDDEKIDDGQRFYLRSLDLVNMATYGFNKEAVAVQKAEYLEDDSIDVCIFDRKKKDDKPEVSASEKKGEKPDVCIFDRKKDDSKQDLEKKVADLEGQNEILKEKEKKLTADLEKEKCAKQNLEKQVADLKEKNKTLTEKESELNKKKSDLEMRVANLEKQVANLMDMISKMQPDCILEPKYVPEEDWMNCYEVCDHWVAADQLTKVFNRESNPVSLEKEGVDFEEDDTTNVAAKLFIRTMDGDRPYTLKIVLQKDLCPNPEKARFDPESWGWFNNAGTKYLAGFNYE